MPCERQKPKCRHSGLGRDGKRKDEVGAVKTMVFTFCQQPLFCLYTGPLPQGLNSAIGLSIVLGLAIAETLIGAGIQDVSLKWPNDVYIQRKKVSGILVELEGQAQGEGHAIIALA